MTFTFLGNSFELIRSDDSELKKKKIEWKKSNAQSISQSWKITNEFRNLPPELCWILVHEIFNTLHLHCILCEKYSRLNTINQQSNQQTKILSIRPSIEKRKMKTPNKNLCNEKQHEMSECRKNWNVPVIAGYSVHFTA